MAPPSWQDCPHCRQKFSPSSLAIHVKRCRDHKGVQRENEAIREQRFMENAFWERPALPSWEPCPNCGQRYGPTAMAPHVKRCRRLRPKGKAAASAAEGGAFEGMWGVEERDNRPLPSMLEKLGNSLKSLVASDEAEGPAPEVASPLDDAERQRLRTLFDKFDENGDGMLSQREHGMLLFNCFPERMLDAKALLAEFRTVDADGSGTVSFEEFLTYYGELLLSQATRHFDEAADMFGFFDADHSGELDQHEFLSLLNNVFPTHCDANEKACATEFASADTDGSSAISFTEFCAYYDRLRTLYGDEAPPLTAEEIRAATTAARKGRPRAGAGAGGAASASAAKPAAKPTGSGKGGGKAAKPGKNAAKSAAGAPSAAPPSATPPAAPSAAGEIAPSNAARLTEIGELLAAGLITQEEHDAVRASIVNELVKCEGCGEAFLPHLLPKHQRSCAAVRPVKKAVKFVERPLPPPQDPLSSDTPDAPVPVEREHASVAYADNGSNSFVACERCGRTFFPDRLPVHQRACQGSKAAKAASSEAEAARRATLDELLDSGLITRDEYNTKLTQP